VEKPAKIGKLIIGMDLGTTSVAVGTEVLYTKSSRLRSEDLPKFPSIGLLRHSVATTDFHQPLSITRIAMSH
jgi:hypothetical protein